MKPLTKTQFEKHLPQVPDWTVIENKKIQKEFKFKNFKEALSFVNKVGELAEKERHHPDLYLHNWNKLMITLSTHALKGLSDNDFIMAAKINKIN